MKNFHLFVLFITIFFIHFSKSEAQTPAQGQECKTSGFAIVQIEQTVKEKWNLFSALSVSFRSNDISYNPFRNFGAGTFRFEAGYLPIKKHLRVSGGLFYTVIGNGEHPNKPDVVAELRNFYRINLFIAKNKNHFELQNRIDIRYFHLFNSEKWANPFEFRYRLLLRYIRQIKTKKKNLSLVANSEFLFSIPYFTPTNKANFWGEFKARENRTSLLLRTPLTQKLFLDFGFLFQTRVNPDFSFKSESYYFSLGLAWRNVWNKKEKTNG